MKTKLITLLIAIFAIFGSAYAQDKVLNIYKGNTIISTYEVSDIDSIKFETAHNGHLYVDLALSVKWATCNVGATSPEAYGDYFAWGETTTKSSYTLSNYNYTSNPTTLPLSADAARVNWGGNWRMPTKAEQEELINNCNWEFTVRNGVNGYKVTSKINGNSIFIPSAGFRDGSNLNDAGSRGYYWTSSLVTTYIEFAYYLSIFPDRVFMDDYSHIYGFTVRPVCE